MIPAAGSRLHGMATAGTTFTGITTIALPVSDQDRTKRLFEELGFTTELDADLGGGFRWVQLTAPDGGTSISVVATADELPTGIDTGIRLATPDARGARDTLVGLGLSVGELLDWPTAPLMFTFTDFDGNRLYVVEPDTTRGS